MMNENNFLEALKKVNVPVLVLDQKWHRLFAVSGKPKEIIENEAELKALVRSIVSEVLAERES